MPAPAKRPSNITVEGARIIFRNFGGAEGPYNGPGERSFGLVLPADLAVQMLNDGWNVKYLQPREEGDEPQPWLPVKVSYKIRPPRVVMVTHRGNPPKPVRVTLPEDLVDMVDYADIANVDVIVNPSIWNFNGKSGVKAYLQTMFVTIQQDELEKKYADVEEIGFNGAPLQIAGAPHVDPEGDFVDGDIIEGEIIE